MAAVTIGIADVKDTKKRMRRAFAGHNEGAFIGFASVELMCKVIRPKRWEVMRAIAGARPLSIREIARRTERDVKSVHGDVSALLKAGVIDRTDDGLIEFTYYEFPVPFVLLAA